MTMMMASTSYAQVPAPIIRAPRIPLELQRVFLASNRGQTVNVPPRNAFQVFPLRKVKSCELFRALEYSSSSSEHEDLSDDEGRRPRRGRRMLKFASGDATLEFDHRTPTNLCHNTAMVAKQLDQSPVSPVRTVDVHELDVPVPVQKPILHLPTINVSRWNLTRDEKCFLDSRPSLPTRKDARRASIDSAPTFPRRRKSASKAFPRRSSVDSIPRLPQRSGAELCLAM